MSKGEWQPISTAPKGLRERVLLYFQGCAGVQVGWHSPQEGWIDRNGPFGANPPTHWMPLPSPPQEKQP